MAATQGRGRLRLSGAKIVDGSGAAAFIGDVIVNGDRIEQVGQNLAPGDASIETMDCSGKVLAPGFIDAHSHMDFYAATQNPEFFDSFTKQGITTFIGGNCGFSPCTIHTHNEHRPLLEDTLFETPKEPSVLCEGMAGFKDKLSPGKLPQNFYQLAGHGSYRTSISGFEKRELKADEYQLLMEKLEQSLLDGAIGLSLGLQYKPGVYISRSEIVDVAKLAAKHNKVLGVHAKAYSCLSGTYPMIPFGRAHNLKAIDDILSVAKETGVKLQFSHLIFVGRQSWPTTPDALELFERAKAGGVDVAFDIFPYACGATLLNTMLPEWFMAAMPGAASSTLKRARLRLEFAIGFKATGFDYRDMEITSAGCDEYAGCEGMRIAQIASDRNMDPFDVLVDLLAKSDSQTRVLFHSYYGPGMVEQLMAHPLCLYSTDAWPELNGGQNPAAFGSFPKFLQISREHNNISLEQCVHKMSGASAARFGLQGRGVVKPGNYADIVIFDNDRVAENPNDTPQKAAPRGVEAVFTNGVRLL